MKKNMLIPIFVLSVTLISVMLTACQPGENVAAASFSESQALSSKAVDTDTAYWIAMGEFYSNRALDADTARWVALGESYGNRGLDADTDRWVALGEAYTNGSD